MNGMLQIIAPRDGATIRLIIEGEMTQAGAGVLEQCWQRAVRSQPGRTLLVDFRAVTFIDAFGRELLLRMRQSGARLGEALSSDDLIAHCRRFLANYKIPRRVEFSETELPKGGSGKILKKVLRERFWAHQEWEVG